MDIRNSRARIFGALIVVTVALSAGALVFFGPGTTPACADDNKDKDKDKKTPCRTKADDEEIARLEKELVTLDWKKKRLENLKPWQEKMVANYTTAKSDYGKQAFAEHKANLDEITAQLNAVDARVTAIYARLKALRSLKPCPPGSAEPEITPPPPPPPPPPHPCRTAQDDAELANLKVKLQLAQWQLSPIPGAIKRYGKRYATLNAKGASKTDAEKTEFEALDKEIDKLGQERNELEREIGALEARIKFLTGLQPCPENKTAPKPDETPGKTEPKPGDKAEDKPGTTTTPKPETKPGVTPKGSSDNKKPKAPVKKKRSKHEISEDDPAYMEDYPVTVTQKPRVKHNDDSGAPHEPGEEHDDSDVPSDHNPDIPVEIPH